MKNITYFVIITLAVFACKKKDPAPATDQLLGTWTLGSTGYVERDGTDLTSDYSGLSIVFQEGRMNVLNGGDLFPVSEDTWEYSPTDKKVIIRGFDDLEITVEASDELLFLRFIYTTYVPGGRLQEITGNYEIRLERN